MLFQRYPLMWGAAAQASSEQLRNNRRQEAGGPLLGHRPPERQSGSTSLGQRRGSHFDCQRATPDMRPPGSSPRSLNIAFRSCGRASATDRSLSSRSLSHAYRWDRSRPRSPRSGGGMVNRPIASSSKSPGPRAVSHRSTSKGRAPGSGADQPAQGRLVRLDAGRRGSLVPVVENLPPLPDRARHRVGAALAMRRLRCRPSA